MSSSSRHTFQELDPSLKWIANSAKVATEKLKRSTSGHQSFSPISNSSSSSSSSSSYGPYGSYEKGSERRSGNNGNNYYKGEMNPNRNYNNNNNHAESQQQPRHRDSFSYDSDASNNSDRFDNSSYYSSPPSPTPVQQPYQSHSSYGNTPPSQYSTGPTPPSPHHHNPYPSHNNHNANTGQQHHPTNPSNTTNHSNNLNNSNTGRNASNYNNQSSQTNYHQQSSFLNNNNNNHHQSQQPQQQMRQQQQSNHGNYSYQPQQQQQQQQQQQWKPRVRVQSSMPGFDFFSTPSGPYNGCAEGIDDLVDNHGNSNNNSNNNKMMPRSGGGQQQQQQQQRSSSSDGFSTLRRGNGSKLSMEDAEALRLALAFHKKGYDIPEYTVDSNMEDVHFQVSRIQNSIEVGVWASAKKTKVLLGALVLETVLKMLPFGNMGTDIKKDVEKLIEDHMYLLEKQYYALGRPQVNYSDKEFGTAIAIVVVSRILTNYNAKKEQQQQAAANAAAARAAYPWGYPPPPPGSTAGFYPPPMTFESKPNPVLAPDAGGGILGGNSWVGKLFGSVANQLVGGSAHKDKEKDINNNKSSLPSSSLGGGQQAFTTTTMAGPISPMMMPPPPPYYPHMDPHSEATAAWTLPPLGVPTSFGFSPLTSSHPHNHSHASHAGHQGFARNNNTANTANTANGWNNPTSSRSPNPNPPSSCGIL